MLGTLKTVPIVCFDPTHVPILFCPIRQNNPAFMCHDFCLNAMFAHYWIHFFGRQKSSPPQVMHAKRNFPEKKRSRGKKNPGLYWIVSTRREGRTNYGRPLFSSPTPPPPLWSRFCSGWEIHASWEVRRWRVLKSRGNEWGQSLLERARGRKDLRKMSFVLPLTCTVCASTCTALSWSKEIKAKVWDRWMIYRDCRKGVPYRQKEKRFWNYSCWTNCDFKKTATILENIIQSRIDTSRFHKVFLHF